jgi:hypothetical protein
MRTHYSRHMNHIVYSPLLTLGVTTSLFLQKHEYFLFKDRYDQLTIDKTKQYILANTGESNSNMLHLSRQVYPNISCSLTKPFGHNMYNATPRRYICDRIKLRELKSLPE